MTTTEILDRARRACGDDGTNDDEHEALLECIDEIERLKDGDWARLSRELHGAETGRDAACAELRRARAEMDRVRAANELVHAHRFDLNSSDPAGHEEWLTSLGEKSAAGGPDSFYHGITFAHRRISHAFAEAVRPTAAECRSAGGHHWLPQTPGDRNTCRDCGHQGGVFEAGVSGE